MSPTFLRRRLSEWSFPTTTFVSEIVATTRAAKETEVRLTNIQGRVPSPLELDSLAKEIRRHWVRVGALTGLPTRTLRRLPWILFYPTDRPKAWLGADAGFRREVLRWLRTGARASAVAALVRSLLRRYPTDLPDFTKWLDQTASLLEASTSVRLRRWQDRHRRFRVLSRSGPKVLASSWLDEDWELDAFLEQTGLDDLGVDAGLRTEVCAEVLNSLSRRLAKAQLGAEQLDARLRILERPNGGVLTDALQVESAHALLGPYSEGDPPEDIKAVVRRFLLRAIGDPRMQPGAWNPVNMADRRVMLRWMVAETLEDFFRLLDRTALDRHWAQRKAFWSVYLDLGVITDAWLVLGQHARQRGRGVLGAAGGTYGLLGKGGDYSQSVLLMRLAGITIAEWSHNGKCRMWLEGSRSAPTLYQRLYKRTQLASDSCEEAVIHDAYGRWKDHIARFIYRQTGIVWRG